jgi:hypothetical protein
LGERFLGVGFVADFTGGFRFPADFPLILDIIKENLSSSRKK